MIQVKTKLKVSDNSGAKLATCIRVLEPKSFKGRQSAVLGSVILVSIRKVLVSKKVKKGSIFRGVIIRSKRLVKRPFGYLMFNTNNIVLLGRGKEPLSSRVIGPMGVELRSLGYLRICSLGAGNF